MTIRCYWAIVCKGEVRDSVPSVYAPFNSSQEARSFAEKHLKGWNHSIVRTYNPLTA